MDFSFGNFSGQTSSKSYARAMAQVIYVLYNTSIPNIDNYSYFIYYKSRI